MVVGVIITGVPQCVFQLADRQPLLAGPRYPNVDPDCEDFLPERRVPTLGIPALAYRIELPWVKPSKVPFQQAGCGGLQSIDRCLPRRTLAEVFVQ